MQPLTAAAAPYVISPQILTLAGNWFLLDRIFQVADVSLVMSVKVCDFSNLLGLSEFSLHVALIVVNL